MFDNFDAVNRLERFADFQPKFISLPSKDLRRALSLIQELDDKRGTKPEKFSIHESGPQATVQAASFNGEGLLRAAFAALDIGFTELDKKPDNKDPNSVDVTSLLETSRFFPTYFKLSNKDAREVKKLVWQYAEKKGVEAPEISDSSQGGETVLSANTAEGEKLVKLAMLALHVTFTEHDDPPGKKTN